MATDQDGAYSLSVDDETIIFISKPSDYMVPVNDVQLPQFYYRHYPNGTPQTLKYGGIAPTGPLPASVDFPLVADDSKPGKGNGGRKEFDAIFFADPQTKNSKEVGDLRKDVIAELKGTDALFGLTVGDVVNDPLDLFPEHNAAVAEVGIPWWNLPGNHDMDYDALTDEHSMDTFKSVYGPTDYSFNYGDVHFVAMDNIEHLGPNQGYRGLLTDAQLAWLKADLAQVSPDKLVVLATHIPLKTNATTSAGVNTANLQGLFDVLGDRKKIYSVSGHDTSNSWQMYMGPQDGWKGIKSFHHQVLAEVRGGGWGSGPLDARGVRAADMADGNPNGYYHLNFSGTKYTPRYKAASLPADFQMRLSFSGGEGNATHVPTGPSGSAGFATPVQYRATDWTAPQVPTLTANVFDGGERHRVEVSVDGGRFAPMTKSAPTNDPYISLLRETNVGAERPVRPEASSHLWTAPLPATLETGQHTVTVRSTDPYGQVSRSTATFEFSAN